MPRFQLHPGSVAVALVTISAAVAAAAPPAVGHAAAAADQPVEAAPLDIYHDGWIDLNKNGLKDPYEDREVAVESRIDDLLSQMTVEEKTMQMATLYGFPRVLRDELPTKAWDRSLWKDGIGNIDEHANGNTNYGRLIANPENDLPYSRHARAMNDVQRFFIERTRLGIPADMTNEGIRGLLHSHATSFPSQLGVGATWDRDLVKEIGRVTASEARALGYTNIYAPILDLARDPRWGRTCECYSEDPFLVGELGVAMIESMQQTGVASTCKHFAVSCIPSGGRDGGARTDPQATWQDVQTIYLQPFRRAVRDASVMGVMASYNDYGGVPVEASRLFLTDILRDEWGFQGYVVSDSGAVADIHRKHRVAPTYRDAVREAVEAGMNVRTNFTPPDTFVQPLRELIRDGELSMDVIDARVRDVLRVKFRLGLFDFPYVQSPEAADKLVNSAEYRQVADRAAHESIVLLKNEAGLLPLKPGVRKVLVTGPLADNNSAWWDRYGPQHIDYVTPLEGIREKLGSHCEVRYVQGCEVIDEQYPESDVFKEPPSEKVRQGIDEAVTAAKDVDVIIAVLGESDEISREDRSRVSLDLPGYQENLLRALVATDKPVVLVLSSGRPMSIGWAAKHVPAIVEMWFSNQQGGRAIADVLVGDYNPAGRLPVTCPRTVGQIPIAFPSRPAAQAKDGGQLTGPLFPFGHGLSYTSFEYSNLRVEPAVNSQGGAVAIFCDVTNTGDREGDEVAQLYLRDDYSSVITFEKMLRGFERVHLEPHETTTIHFTLTPEHLALYDRDGQWTVEEGTFTVMIGASSVDVRLKGKFEIGQSSTAPHLTISATPADVSEFK